MPIVYRVRAWSRFLSSRALSTALPLVPALMLPPMVEATCVSDNTFTLADELVAAIEERGEDAANPGARMRRHLLNDEFASRAASLPKIGNLTLHDRR